MPQQLLHRANVVTRLQQMRGKRMAQHMDKCRIPDDCIDKNRYPLFMARSVLRELIESLPSTRSL